MGDVIYREQAMQELEKGFIFHSYAGGIAKRIVEGLPSAEKIGTWKNITLWPYDITGQAVGECSLCGKQRIVDNYCSNCGARMVEE